MRRVAVLMACLLVACDGGDDGGTVAPDMAIVDATLDMQPAPDAAVDAAVDMQPLPDVAVLDMGPEPDAMGRLPVGIDAPRVRECPALPRAPQVVLTAAEGAAERSFDGPVTVSESAGGRVVLTLEGGRIELQVPLRAAALLRPEASFTALLRRRSMGFTEWLLVLRSNENRIVFAAATGTSWVTMQFTDRTAVGENIELAGGCAEVGERCFDRVDREVIFAGGNRRRALLPGTESDFTTDGGSFLLAVDQAYQVACDVLCPNVANQWFSFWMLRDEPREPVDSDGDGVVDGEDVCPQLADPDQADGDADGIGDACDQAPATEGPGTPCTHPLDCPSRTCRPEGICAAGLPVVPGAPEVCDGDDDDGDGQSDEGLDPCAEADRCVVDGRVTGEGLTRGSSRGILHAEATLSGACDAVQVTGITWDLGADGMVDGEGDSLMLRRLRGLDSPAGILRLTDSRGGITEVLFRPAVETSTYCP